MSNVNNLSAGPGEKGKIMTCRRIFLKSKDRGSYREFGENLLDRKETLNYLLSGFSYAVEQSEQIKIVLCVLTSSQTVANGWIFDVKDVP